MSAGNSFDSINDTTSPIHFDADGLIPVVAQEGTTGAVLLLAYMNAEALRRTLSDGALTLWSRSRGRLWRKGEQSGNVLRVSELRVNCEGNSLLARVRLDGPGACHEGYYSCYYRTLTLADDGGYLAASLVEPRAFDPAMVYGADAPSAEVEADQSEDAAAARLQHTARALFAAYERLRDMPVTAGSTTAATLHAPLPRQKSRWTLSRAQEELDELRGVLSGAHQHEGGAADVILEASQVGYWTMLTALLLRQPYDAWNPHLAWLAGWQGVALTPNAVSSTRDEEAETLLRACGDALIEAGALCRVAAVHPSRALEVDLASLQAKRGS